MEYEQMTGPEKKNGRRWLVIAARISAALAVGALLALAYVYFLLPGALPWNDAGKPAWLGDTLDYLSPDFKYKSGFGSGDFSDMGMPSWGNDELFAVIIAGFDYDYPGTIREGGGKIGRTDAIMLLIIPKDRPSATVVSIPRDTLVPVDNYGTRDRINSVYRGVSMQGLKNAVTFLTGIEADRWAALDFSGFVGIIDKLGGVDIEVENHMSIWDDLNGRYVYIKPGMQHMDGETALMYVRFRGDPMGDISRTSRQMRFIRAVASSAMQMSTLGEISGLISDVRQHFTTDMADGEILSLGLRLMKIGLSNLDGFTLPGGFNGPYWEANIEQTRKLLNEAILGKPDEPEVLNEDEP